ncbi:MAG: MtrAB system histidine kinase MtrB [Rhodoluna sp.]|nr:MtrAB system histidine kinase MtrB [Rhodoluna sp.]
MAKFLRRLIAFFRRSLQARWVAATLIMSTVALVSVGGFLSYSISAGLFETRQQQIMSEAARAVVEVQNTFTASTSTDTATLQGLMNTVVPNLESKTSNSSRTVALLRSPGQSNGQYLQSPVSLGLDAGIVPEALREQVRTHTSKLVYKSVSLTVGAESHPGLIVGSHIEIPVAGAYELYLVYDLGSAQQTLDFVQSTLVFGGAIMILLIGGVSFFVTGRIVSPMRKAAEVSAQLAAGDLEPRLEVAGEDVIAALGQSFNTMADSMQTKIKELSAVSQMQQVFVSDVSHELRTPLTTIKLSAELLQARRDELSPAAVRNLDKLSGQINRFEDLLADLLEISRFDAKSVVGEFEVEDLNGVVGMALAHIQPLADSKGSVLEVEIPNGPVEAEFDPRRIERVLRNLLSNAIEHGEGKPIRIEVAQSPTAVAVTVTDYGVGMTQAQVARVFDRFWRADPARKRTTGGTGLGLAIALADTTLHNGWLQLVSSPNKGTTFRLTLPRKQKVLFTQSPLPLGRRDS